MTQNRESIRAFVAIDLPDETREFLKNIIADFKPAGGDVSWVKPHGIHLTLKFLGNVDSDVVGLLETALDPVFSACRPGEISVAGVGAFPHLRRPRVIWAGLTDGSGMLSPLAQQVEDALTLLGFAREKRPFRPHLTLGRVKSQKGMSQLVEAVRNATDLSGPAFSVREAVLFQSILKPSGAQYVPLRRFEFSVG